MNLNDSIHLSRINVRAGGSRSAGSFKILLYSHDSYGLGHLRRNLAIAKALLKRIPEASALIVTGSPCATQFPVPERCDIVKIPAIGKDDTGAYISRYLNLSLNCTVAMRRQLIMGVYESYDPDLILVDHQPAGLLGEMLDTLKRAREDEKIVLFGVRDIVDAPSVIEKSWCSRECAHALEHYYDHIFIYGDVRVFDPVQEYPQLRKFRSKISIPGYLIEPRETPAFKSSDDGGKHVLVTVGGGDDGETRIETYLNALLPGPAEWKSHIVTGPLMRAEKVREFKHFIRKKGLARSVKISQFHGDIPLLMQRADAVVSMAGYNSCLELLQSGTPAVLMPREHMRLEQSIRARRLAELGLVQTISTGGTEALKNAVQRAISTKQVKGPLPNLEGLANLCDQVVTISGIETNSEPGYTVPDSGNMHG